MTMTEWLIFFLVIQLIHFLGTWKLYVKAGRKAWEALVPVYNAVVLMKIINRPWWWVILLFIPIVNQIMFPVLWVETIRSFGRNSRQDTILAIVTLGLYIFYVNYVLDVKYIEDRSLKPRTDAGEWISSILFAVVAATLVHTYFMQPYVIPTPSLEKTLLVGDFLFVSKFHYGAKTPMTTVSMPMVHDAIPFTGGKMSYLPKPQLPYFRLPGFENIERNDIVVFNWPADTLVVIDDPSKGVRHKPLDKRSNYVKRCVGIPGDSLEVRDGYVYINGNKNVLPDRAKLQFSYIAQTKGGLLNLNYLHDRYGISSNSVHQLNNSGTYALYITDEEVAKLKNNPNILSIERAKSQKGEKDASVFPHSPNFNWNVDHFGPIYIPEAGKTVQLNLDVLPLYKRIIEEYEDNTLSVRGNQIMINGQQANSYTFKQDYYWMMGDNRNNSQDARMWGYVPYDHVVGKPVFVWMSFDKDAKGLFNKVRWDRVFTTVGGSGKPVSYLRYFLIALGGWFVFNYFRKKRKAA
ncbi:signal peptidase I [Flavobacteriaceae bacterium R38]|nr:signal peptidase I [Flavobacteriaceae bacterium R38]